MRRLLDFQQAGHIHAWVRGEQPGVWTGDIHAAHSQISDMFIKSVRKYLYRDKLTLPHWVVNKNIATCQVTAAGFMVLDAGQEFVFTK